MLDEITSGLVGVSSRDFFQSTSREAGVIKWAQFLQWPPQKFATAKESSKIFRNFWQLSTLIAKISGKYQHIKNGKSYWSSTTSPTLGLTYFGPQTKKLLTLINVQPNGLFSGDYISALRGCCAMKFLHTLEIDQGLLAHTRRGTGVPSPQTNRENLKLALKFSMLESITSGIVEVFSLNFFMQTAITAREISSSWNWFCTRTCSAGRPYVWLCHARLVVIYILVRPPGTAVPDGLMFYRRCYLLGRPEPPFRTGLYSAADVFFFATRSPSSLDRSPWNFATWSESGLIL